MSIAAAMIRMRPARGPALGRAPRPVPAPVPSALLHVVLAVVFVLAPPVWSRAQPKTYVVNLVPAVAAVGSPQGQTTPALPPRPDEVAPALPARPAELPQREAARETAAPEMPARARELPERAMAPRPSAAPRAGDKELPSMASSSAKPAPALERALSETVARA